MLKKIKSKIPCYLDRDTAEGKGRAGRGWGRQETVIVHSVFLGVLERCIASNKNIHIILKLCV